MPEHDHCNHSLGIFDCGDTPVEAATWGGIKAIYDR